MHGRVSVYDLGESAYCRSKEVVIVTDANDGKWCDHCQQKVKDVPVIHCDTSDGEYGPVALCKTCVMELLHKHETSINPYNTYEITPVVSNDDES